MRLPMVFLVVVQTTAFSSLLLGQVSKTKLDPFKVTGAEACGECHLSEYNVWKGTPHATGFKTLHRLKASERIAEKMGDFLIKRESLCLDCHYTPEVKRDQLRAKSGVSCESCHGAASDWIDVHNDYGGKDVTWDSEPAAHKQERIAKSVAAGMLRPGDLYSVVSNCYSCHTVPHEQLVNVGGHTSGSTDFEFSAWQEQIRHNFLDSFRTGDGTENKAYSAEHRRVMYLLGRSLELEYSLRGMAEAKENKRYAKAMTRRVRNAVGEVRALAARLQAAELETMVDLVRGAKIKPNNRAGLLETAEQIGNQTRTMLARVDSLPMERIQGLMDGTDSVNFVADAAPAATVAPSADAPAPDRTVPTSETPARETASVDQPSPARPVAAPVVKVTGDFKTRLHPPEAHDTIGPAKCGNCHDVANEWWYEDRHYAAMDRFFDNEIEARAIATLYGLKGDQWLKGNQICTDCHATVVSGREARDARDAVSCESCHGPAADYLEVHKEGEEGGGTSRPGYQKGLAAGMRELRNDAVRAKTCAQCHYINDPRLLSAGHPSGEGFDAGVALGKINHWGQERHDVGAVNTAYASEKASRGPVPDVVVATLQSVRTQPVVAATPRTNPTPDAPAVTEARPQTRSAPTVSTPLPAPGRQVKAPTPRSARPAGTRPPAKQATPVGAQPPQDASIEDMLRFLKQKLEQLYESKDKPGGTP